MNRSTSLGAYLLGVAWSVMLLAVPFAGFVAAANGGHIGLGMFWMSVAIVVTGLSAYLASRFDPSHRLAVAFSAAMTGYAIFALAQIAISPTGNFGDDALFFAFFGISALVLAILGSATGTRAPADRVGHRNP